MDNPLATYLAGHLAGSVHATEVLKNLREAYVNDPLGEFAAGLLLEIEADRSVLQSLSERVGSGSSCVKEFGAWVSEKVSRLKFKHVEGRYELGTFEALNFSFSESMENPPSGQLWPLLLRQSFESMDWTTTA